MYKFKLTIDDYSYDRHNLNTCFIIESNVPVIKIHEAFFKAVKKSGINFINVFYSQNTQNTFTKKELNKLLKLEIIDQDSYNKFLKHNENGDYMTTLLIRFITKYSPNIQLNIIQEKINGNILFL